MSTPNVTYQTIITQVLNWITTNCKNVGTNYDSLDSFFKSGSSVTVAKTVSKSVDQTSPKNGTDHACATFSVSVATGISQVGASTPESELTTFLNGLNLPKSAWSYPIDNKNLYAFLYNIFLFCSFKIVNVATVVPANAGTLYGTAGNATLLTWNLTPAERKAVVYSTQAISGGSNMDPKPSGTSSTPTKADNIVVGASRDHTLKAVDVQNIVNQILNNRLARKLMVTTLTGSVT